MIPASKSPMRDLIVYDLSIFSSRDMEMSRFSYNFAKTNIQTS